jgi:hypothetical protein
MSAPLSVFRFDPAPPNPSAPPRLTFRDKIFGLGLAALAVAGILLL